MIAAEKKKFKSLAHKLKPVVIIGQNGLTENIMLEIENALDHHELIKIKIRADKEERLQTAEEICQHTQAVLIQNIGHILTLYRENPENTKKG